MTMRKSERKKKPVVIQIEKRAMFSDIMENVYDWLNDPNNGMSADDAMMIMAAFSVPCPYVPVDAMRNLFKHFSLDFLFGEEFVDQLWEYAEKGQPFVIMIIDSAILETANKNQVVSMITSAELLEIGTR